VGADDEDKKDTVSYASVEYAERTIEKKPPLIRSISSPPFQSLMGARGKPSFAK
jgi:hypothetical protein